MEWAYSEVDTPRGRYQIDGSRIMRVNADGRSEQVYSTAYLRKEGNVWVQKHEPDLPIDGEIATRPLAIVYDDRSDNVTVALGIQGVVVGMPDGRWEKVAVGRYTPTDFSFTAKTRLLLSRLDFWALAVVLSLTMTGAAQLYSWQWDEDRHPSDTGRRFVVVLLAVLVATVIAWTLLRVMSINELFVFGTIGLAGLMVLAPVLVATAICSMTLSSNVRRGLAWSIGILSVIGSCILLAFFGGEDDGFYPLFFSVISVPAFTLGATAMAVSCPQLKYWPVAGAALTGMMVLILLAFMLWLHLGIALGLAKLSALAFTALVAILLAGHLSRKTVRLDPQILCPGCQQANSLLAKSCYNCGSPLTHDTKAG